MYFMNLRSRSINADVLVEKIKFSEKYKLFYLLFSDGDCLFIYLDNIILMKIYDEKDEIKISVVNGSMDFIIGDCYE